MRKYLLILVALLAMVGAFRGGLEVGERSQASIVDFSLGQAVSSEKHAQLSDLRGCLFAVDSDLLHFVRVPTHDGIAKLVWRLAKCDAFLTSLGEAEQDEETDSALGEARLFFDGYYLTVNEILGREIMLMALYNEITLGNVEKVAELQGLEAQQSEHILEAKEFRDRLEWLILRAW